MKINSHLLGILIGGGALLVWYMMTKPSVVGTYLGYNLIKINGRYVGEKVANDRAINPQFDTVDDLKHWIDGQVNPNPANIMDTSEVQRLNALVNQVAQ